MANITEYLNKIRTAIYGEEVRGSIYNAIDLMNYESSQAMEMAEACNRQYIQLQNNVDGLNRRLTELSTTLGNQIDTLSGKVDVLNSQLETAISWVNSLKVHALTDSEWNPSEPVTVEHLNEEEE